MTKSAEKIALALLDLRGKTVCKEPLGDLLAAATRYARIRVDWALCDHEGRVELGSKRTVAHEVLIGECNILSRAMMRAGESNEWRADLGTDRQFIGDVACHIHCYLGLAAR